MEKSNNFDLKEKINKQTLDIFFLVDNSGSMAGASIAAVNNAVRDALTMIPEIENATADSEIKIGILRFSDDASWVYEGMKSAKEIVWNDLKASGSTNLTAAYNCLNDKLTKESNGGMMPDFGGVAPVIILMTDGLPTSEDWPDALAKLKVRGWFNVALKYAMAVNIEESEAIDVLRSFTGDSETVLQISNPEALRAAIRIVMVTSSQVKSTAAGADQLVDGAQNEAAKQEVKGQLSKVKGAKW